MSFLFNLAILSAVTDGTAAAQEQGAELGQNVNAAGFKRRPVFLRLVTEVLLGFLAAALILGVELFVIPHVGIPSWDNKHEPMTTLICGPALMAGGVYLGGRWMGGRGRLGWTVLGSYGGLLVLYGVSSLSYAVIGSAADWASLILFPFGAILACELSDFFATRRLKRASADQDKVSELEENVNAAGFTRRSMPLRIGAEAGMGLLGEALTLGGGYGLGTLVNSVGHLGELSEMLLFSGIILAVPAVTAAGVYYGGKWTGGRDSLGRPMVASYLSSLVGGSILLVTGVHNCRVTICLDPPEFLLYTAPLWSLVGSIVAYEISDRSATNKLKDKRKGALKSAEEPLMFQLLTLPF